MLYSAFTPTSTTRRAPNRPANHPASAADTGHRRTGGGRSSVRHGAAATAPECRSGALGRAGISVADSTVTAENLAAAAERWAGLDFDLKNAWTEYAGAHGLGSGAALYRVAQARRAGMGLPMAIDAPQLPPPTAPAGVRLIPAGRDGGPPRFAVDHSDRCPTGLKLLLECTPSVAAAGGEPASGRRDLRTLATDPADMYVDAMPAAWNYPAPGPSGRWMSGDRVLVRARFVTVEGVAGAPFVSEAVAG